MWIARQRESSNLWTHIALLFRGVRLAERHLTPLQIEDSRSSLFSKRVGLLSWIYIYIRLIAWKSESDWRKTPTRQTWQGKMFLNKTFNCFFCKRLKNKNTSWVKSRDVDGPLWLFISVSPNWASNVFSVCLQGMKVFLLASHQSMTSD